MSKASDASDYLGAVIGFCFVVFIIYAIGSSIFNANAEGQGGKNDSKCKDVTSYDRNWDNDMLCTRDDGTRFYTDYAGARNFESDDNDPVSEDSAVDLSNGEGGSCEDVTSYDYDWNNDMLCTRSDGSTFYTDYAGAEAFEG